MRQYWYTDVDIHLLLQRICQGDKSCRKTDAASLNVESKDKTHLIQTVNRGCDQLNKDKTLKAVMIPINLGETTNGIFHGNHWVALVLRREEDKIVTYFKDSFGDEMDEKVPGLRQILGNHGVKEENIKEFSKKQQANGYDCGPWTVLNLEAMAKTGNIVVAEEKEIKSQREELEVITDRGVKFEEESQAANCSGISEGTEAEDNTELSLVNMLGKVEISPPLLSSKLGKNPAACYIINIPASVSAPRDAMDGDSSDEEAGEDFKKKHSSTKLSDIPYRVAHRKEKTTRKKSSTPKVKKEKISKVKKEKGYVPDTKEAEFLKDDKSGPSHVVQPLLKKLTDHGTEPGDCEIKNIVSVSFGLNRMLSLSTRKNNVLKRELGSEVNSEIRYEKFGFFWECQWVNSKEERVSHAEVRSFYKKLKNVNPKLAEEFRESNERDIPVPYQEIRERLKNHSHTKKLIQEFREEHSTLPLYLSFIDSDTLDFNGVYSAYMRIVRAHPIPPTVMSTGYEFFTKDYNFAYPLKIASQLDMLCRAITARHIPFGIYYPEPNMCVLIPDNQDSVVESFIDSHQKNGKFESPILLRQILEKRTGVIFIFSDRAPVVIASPKRASNIIFSKAFKMGYPPNEDDISKLKKVCQSHFDGLELAKALYYNRGFKVNTTKRGDIGAFNKMVVKLRDNPTDPEGYIGLKNFINEEILMKIEALTKDLKVVEELLSQQEGLQVIREILESRKIGEMLREEQISYSEVLALYKLSLTDKQSYSFDDLIDDIENARYLHGLEIAELIELYKKSPMHLKCLAGDPVEIAQELAPEVDEIVLEYIEEGDLWDIYEVLGESDQLLFRQNLEWDDGDEAQDSEEYNDSDEERSDYDTESSSDESGYNLEDRSDTSDEDSSLEEQLGEWALFSEPPNE
jgi:hypothetical protein